MEESPQSLHSSFIVKNQWEWPDGKTRGGRDERERVTFRSHSLKPQTKGQVSLRRRSEKVLGYCSPFSLWSSTSTQSNRAEIMSRETGVRVKRRGKIGDNEDFINQRWYQPSFITPLLKPIHLHGNRKAWLWKLLRVPSHNLISCREGEESENILKVPVKPASGETRRCVTFLILWKPE